MHVNLSQFKCDQCDSKFKYKCDLSVHFRTHHSENMKFHQCFKCDLKFTILSNLRRHTADVHDNVKVECNQCGVKFPKHNLKRHMSQCTHRMVVVDVVDDDEDENDDEGYIFGANGEQNGICINSTSVCAIARKSCRSVKVKVYIYPRKHICFSLFNIMQQ